MVNYVPVEVLYKYVTPQKQTDVKACTSFAIAHGLETQLAIRGNRVKIDANKLRAAQLKFLGKDKMKTINYDEGFKIFSEGYKGIKTYAPVKLRFNFNRFRRWIWKGYPMFMTIKYPHAVVAVGYGEDFFWVIDSIGGVYRKIKDFNSIKESYLTFINENN